MEILVKISRKALVLGGNGFIGRNIAAQLINQGWDVTIGTRHPEEPVHALLPADTQTFGVHLETYLDAQQWQPRIAGFDLVVNAVGILRQRGKETYDTVHHLGPKALAEACAEKQIPMIHISALGLRNPVRSRFLSSKLRGEDALLRTGTRVCIVRPSLLDGDQGFGALWVRRVSRWPVQFYPANANGLITCCSVVELGEAVSNLAMALVNKETNVPCLIEMGGSIEETIGEHLARRHHAVRGFRPLQIPIPKFIARLFAHLFDLVHFSPYSFGHYELLRFDNAPRPNRLPDWLGRAPADVITQLSTNAFSVDQASLKPLKPTLKNSQAKIGQNAL
jgi:hypothetical protein